MKRSQYSLRNQILLVVATAATIAWAASHLYAALALSAVAAFVTIITMGLVIGRQFCVRAPRTAASLCAVSGTLLIVCGAIMGVAFVVNVANNLDGGALWLWAVLLATFGIVFCYAARCVLSQNHLKQ